MTRPMSSRSPNAPIITSISLDHPEFLGDTIEKIAYREGRNLQEAARRRSSASSRTPRREVLEREARRVGAPLDRRRRGLPHLARRTGASSMRTSAACSICRCRACPAATSRPTPPAPSPPCAPSRRRSAPQHIEAGLTRAEWPARLQRLYAGASSISRRRAPRCGSTAAIMTTAAACWPRPWPSSRTRRRGRWCFVCGAQTTKDVRALLKHFVGLAREVVAVPVEGEHKSWPPAGDRRASPAPRACPAPRRAASRRRWRSSRTRSFDAPPRVLIAGSLYLAAACWRQRLGDRMSRAARFARAATSPREPGLTLLRAPPPACGPPDRRKPGFWPVINRPSRTT